MIIEHQLVRKMVVTKNIVNTQQDGKSKRTLAVSYSSCSMIYSLSCRWSAAMSSKLFKITTKLGSIKSHLIGIVKR